MGSKSCLWNSSTDSGELLGVMFSDSDIAKSFKCGPANASYLPYFGLAPYFRDILHTKIKNVLYYTISFDESLNESLQKGQMDLLIRFWDEEKQSNHTLFRF